jgi:hypothetical protein
MNHSLGLMQFCLFKMFNLMFVLFRERERVQFEGGTGQEDGVGHSVSRRSSHRNHRQDAGTILRVLYF